MKGLREIIRYSFKYRATALLVIGCNILYVIFNLLSLALFVPFLQILFDSDSVKEVASQPVYEGGFVNFFKYCSEYFNYVMQDMAQADPKGALLFVCISVAAAFLLKNLFRYGAVWFQSQLRMAVVRDIRDALFEKSLRLPLSYYTDERKGDMMARMQSDVGEIEVCLLYTSDAADD